MDARVVLVSAGSGRPWFLLRRHPPTAVSTGRHHRPDDTRGVRAVFEQLLEAIHHVKTDMALFDLP